VARADRSQTYAGEVDATTAATLGAMAGIALTAIAVVAVRLSERSQHHVPPSPVAAPLPEGVADVLAVLRSSGIVLDSSDTVVNNSPAAVANGLVRGSDLAQPQLLALARQVRRDGVIREVELELPEGPAGRPGLVVGARVAPLGSSHVLLLVDDRSQSRRLEEIRRDFVANVSHELKTPVGGLALLAEAVLDAHDDPDAVARFARRMQVESTRLTRLVQEIVDLSRLQAAASLSDPHQVDLGAAAREALDRSRLAAEDKDITVSLTATGDCEVWGNHELLVTAVRNLVGNAVAYSEPHTRVTVRVRPVEDDDSEQVELAVTDQGRGIPAAEQSRIFERFYRVDAARSRATGGTGLGLSIVKHVAANHGGDVGVWSEPGRGSTFTMRLPAATVGRQRAAEARHTDDTVNLPAHRVTEETPA
jgi:two-component system, OmpR family, sensor histidine kinase SenX3